MKQQEIKKIIKEKSDISVSIFSDKNSVISRNKNYLFLEIASISNFSYKENKIYSRMLDIDIYLLINKGD